MTSPARGMLRLTRAGALALVIVALSLTAHMLAGGMAPGPVGFGVVTVPVLGLCLVVTSRRVGLPVLAGVFAITQLALHRSFDALSGHGGHGGDARMTVAHVVATIACVLVLTRGESAVWSLCQRLVGRVPAAAAGHLTAIAVPTASVERVLTSHLATGGLRVRGPPRAPRPA